MKIWVDADACPNVIKEILDLFQTASSLSRLLLTIVALLWPGRLPHDVIFQIGDDYIFFR